MSDQTTYKSKNNAQNDTQTIIVKPKLAGFFWVYFLTSIPGLITSILGIILMIALIVGVSKGAGNIDKEMSKNSNPLSFKTLQESNAPTSNKILVYNLEGAITSAKNLGSSSGNQINIHQVKEDFTKIKLDNNIRNVVFRFDSPGGEVYASEILGDLIQDLLNNKGQKEGVFYYDSLAASGALLATNKVKNYVIGSKYGETGSIGVRLGLPNYAKLADNIGYKETVIKAGDNKDIGNPLREITSEEQTYFQKTVDKIYNEFLNTMAKGRSKTVEQIKPLANGFVYFNDEAKNYGLIDEVGELSNAYTKASSNAGLKDYVVEEINPSKPFIQELFGDNLLGNLTGLNKISNAANRLTELKPGVTYMIDENKI
jgi:protease IV